MKRSKHFIVFTLALLLFAVLCSCNNTGEIKDTTADTTISQSPTGTTQQPETTEPEDTETTLQTCEHSYKATVEIESGILTEGVMKNVCEYCGDFYTEAIPATKSVKILAIGNSFSDDAMEYLWDIMKSGGVEKITLGRLYIGSCSIDTHCMNLIANKNAYTYYKNTAGKWESYTKRTIKSALDEEEWDIITVQQVSGSSGVSSSLDNLKKFVSEVKKAEPLAKIYWHMTWAYQSTSTHNAFATYNSDQMTMYKAIVDTVNSRVLTNSDILGVIPAGTAIQNLRSSYVGDTVTRDGYHMSYDYGRYTTALTWYAFFTGKSAENVSWVPSSYTAILNKNIDVIRESVDNAIKTPYEVTRSTHQKAPEKDTDADLISYFGYDINDYTELDWALQVKAFYNSSLGTQLYTEEPNSHQYIASKKFTKETLPVGSIIIIDSGYTYRPERWNSQNTNGGRPGVETTQVTIVTESWWKGYAVRAFNLGTTAKKTMTESDIVHFRIYVPKN